MTDIEFRVVSGRREGLLLELGQLVIGSGFSLVRQRMTSTADGVVLVMVVRGPEQNVLGLEDRLGSHPLVLSFEASAPESPRAAPVADAAPQVPERGAAAPAPDPRRIEAFLAALARDYPDVFGQVLAFEREIPGPHREATLRYAGERLGAWIYKRDFALGARLGLGDSVRHIALPALRNLLHAELDGEGIRVRSSPLSGTGMHRGSSCHFLCGCLEGVLRGPGHLGRPRVNEAFCRNSGADSCVFTIAS